MFTINIVDAQHLPDHDHTAKVLHFSHPLVSESPSPDTKIRADYLYMNMNEDDLKMHTFVIETEYAFYRWLSLEMDVPYTILSNEMTLSRLDNIEVGLKYANIAICGTSPEPLEKTECICIAPIYSNIFFVKN